MILLHDDFRIGLVISTRVAVANTASRGLITRPIRKSSLNDIIPITYIVCWYKTLHQVEPVM